DTTWSRGLGDVYKRQMPTILHRLSNNSEAAKLSLTILMMLTATLSRPRFLLTARDSACGIPTAMSR
ncbi:hypothetical protein, partial [Prevotella histicola]|uniref:hypothetical protein n=1 Tax=Prevotella histicola TaxID=470565 RepID=UPI002150CC3D